MFQAQPSAFDTGIEDQLPWYEMGYDDILATMAEGTKQHADKVGASQWTQPPPVLTQPSQLAAGGATTGGGATPVGSGATPVGGGATPDAPGSSKAATPSPDQLGPRVVSAPDP
jgi:hypothetical protein